MFQKSSKHFLISIFFHLGSLTHHHPLSTSCLEQVFHPCLWHFTPNHGSATVVTYDNNNIYICVWLLWQNLRAFLHLHRVLGSTYFWIAKWYIIGGMRQNSEEMYVFVHYFIVSPSMCRYIPSRFVCRRNIRLKFAVMTMVHAINPVRTTGGRVSRPTLQASWSMRTVFRG